MSINLLIIKTDTEPTVESNNLIIGDSHSAKGINPNILGDNYNNFSQVSEPLTSSYLKIKYLVKFHNIDTIILSISPHNFAEYQDSKYEDTIPAYEHINRIYPLLLTENKESCEMLNLFNKNILLLTLFKKLVLFPKLNHGKFHGEFIPMDTDTNYLDKVNSVINRHYYSNTKVQDISLIQLDYFGKIIDYCNSQKVTLIFTSPPVSNVYRKAVPTDFIQSFEDLMDFTQDKNRIFNEFNTPYEDSLFFDADHLNKNGAEVYTLRLKKYLKT